jgi:hypothetical protein
MEREELLQSALADDINAIPKTVCRISKPTEILGVSLTYSRNDVDDITQDTLSMRLVKYRPLIRTLL